VTTSLVGKLPKVARQRVVHRSDTERRESCRSLESVMPLIRVEIREGWSPAEKAGLLDAIHAAAVEALKIPNEDRTQFLTEHPTEAFEIPPGKGDRFTLVEITMFAGRSLDAKRRLYRAVVTNLGRLGIPPFDVLIVLHEVPLENWGIQGGTPASDVDLGFEVGV
jgi:phenylpyruvate tautomerase PptA (4-oxalocrotonate tautomerase family)